MSDTNAALGSTTTGDGGAASDDALMREMRLQRNLKILVAGLGLLIGAGLLAIVLRVIWLARQGPAGGASVSENVTAVALPSGSDIILDLPTGARIVAVSISGNRVAVHHESPAGAVISVVDLETGRRVADIKTRFTPPRN
ncbi:MAG: hypothetical protein ACRCS9_05995 [Hyphomicrobium sp.]